MQKTFDDECVDELVQSLQDVAQIRLHADGIAEHKKADDKISEYNVFMSAKHSISDRVVLEEDVLLSDSEQSESSPGENDTAPPDMDASQGYSKAKQDIKE